jgi:hypothetical protein
MARLETKKASLVSKLFNPNTGRAIAVRSDRKVLRKSPLTNGWVSYGNLKSHIDIDQFVALKKGDGFRDISRSDIPSLESISRMEYDGIAEATDGCSDIEPDGNCCHGCPAWPQAVLSF